MGRTRVIRLSAAALVAALALGGAGAGAAVARDGHATARSLVVTTRKVGKLGTILVNAKGMTLYMFVPDKRKRVTCFKTCAVIWPPIKVTAGEKLVAEGAAKQKLLGSDPDRAGGRVATYDGWPLYLYIGDKKPGMATGQAINLNGGLWYVLSPSGKVIKTKAT